MPANFITTEDWSRDELQQLLDMAVVLKSSPWQQSMAHKSIALLFFNPSMRTRTSFELGMHQLGGVAVVLQPGKDAWGIEFEDLAVMDGAAEEHIQEVAGVLSTWVDMIGIRSFPPFVDWQTEKQDPVINALARHASVPVINMETIVHPCQELALMKTMQDRLGDVSGREFLLTWTWHPRPLNTAVANSALLIASKFGMNVTLLCPDERYLLDDHYVQVAGASCAENGTTFTVTHDIEQAYSNKDFVYAKSWGALPFYGDAATEAEIRAPYRHFIVDEQKMAMTREAYFSHCLPLRRNIKATDAVMNSDKCLVIDEAENRLHVQKAVMMTLCGQTAIEVDPR